MLVGSRVGAGQTGLTISPLVPSLFPVKGASKLRLHGSETPVAQTGQHPWLQPRCLILPIQN